MPLAAGIDSSTQSTKVVVCDTDSGEVLSTARAPHPEGTEVDPAHWQTALGAAGEGVLDRVAALSVGAQQHGMVVLDEAGDVVRPALLWNDTRSARAAADLVAELGGPQAWADAVGSVPVASFTVTKLRWLAQAEPESARRVAQVCLPHDWLTSRLLPGRPLVTDRGDASGTGYWSPATGAYREDLLERALGTVPGVPLVLDPGGTAGVTASGAVVAAGTGDNMAAALGLGMGPGDVCVSLGTSGTVFAVQDDPAADPTGTVAGFADATGRFLPLVATLNAARVLTATAGLLGTDLAGLDELARSAPAGAHGLVLLPYLDGERTPNLPDASGTLLGMRRTNLTPAHLARAAVEGMLCGLADGLDALRAQGLHVRRVLLIGGAAQSAAVQEVAAGVLGAPVLVPTPGEWVARGAARQATWALTGRLPEWPVSGDLLEPRDGAAGVRQQYAAARHLVHPST